MKLSELNTDEGMDVLCELTPFIANISIDEGLIKELKSKIKVSKDASRAEVLMIGCTKLTKIVPILLRDHKEDVMGILGILNGKSAEEMASQNLMVTLKQIRDALNDKELMDFFKLSGTRMGSE